MRDLDSMTVLAGAVNVWPPTLMEPPPSTMIDASGDAAGALVFWRAAGAVREPSKVVAAYRECGFDLDAFGKSSS